MSENKSNKGIIILAVITVLSVLAAVIGVVHFLRGRTKGEYIEEARQEQSESSAETDAGENKDASSEAESVSQEEDESSFTRLVCIPAEYMSLRKSAGLGDDVITTLTAGTLLKWQGQKETVDDKDYYFVEVESTGQEGYVAERFCVEMDYSYDEKELPIVDVNDDKYSYDDMMSDIKELTDKYPDILSSETIGRSVDGRDILALTLGSSSATNHVMLQASIHGREYINTPLVMRLIEYYCRYYEEGSYNKISYKDLFDKTAFHIIPMANPDGVSISQSGKSGVNDASIIQRLYECYQTDKFNLCKEIDTNGDPNWVDHYKDENFVLAESDNPQEITFEEYLTLWKANANAVDLNSNFDAGWYDLNLKTWKSYANYPGDYPVSEPESQALVNYAQRYDYVCYVSYHSRGQLIYYDVAGNSPENSEKSTKLAKLFEDHIKYDPVKTTEAYNVNLGGFGDWIQLGLNRPSITIESGKKPCPTPIEEYAGIWHRHRESWAMLAEQFY